MIPCFTVETHGDRLQLCELFYAVYAGRLQEKHDGQAMDHILDGSIVGKRNDILLGQPEQRTTDNRFILFLLDGFDIKRGFRIRTAPGNCLMGKAGRLYAVGDKGVVAIIIIASQSLKSVSFSRHFCVVEIKFS